MVTNIQFGKLTVSTPTHLNSHTPEIKDFVRTELDETAFEEKKAETEVLETQLKGLYRALDALIRQRKGLFEVNTLGIKFSFQFSQLNFVFVFIFESFKK